MIDAILKSPQAQNTPEDESRKKRLIDFQDKDGETGCSFYIISTDCFLRTIQYSLSSEDTQQCIKFVINHSPESPPE